LSILFISMMHGEVNIR